MRREVAQQIGMGKTSSLIEFLRKVINPMDFTLWPMECNGVSPDGGFIVPEEFSSLISPARCLRGDLIGSAVV